jgi:hypothetical protein
MIFVLLISVLVLLKHDSLQFSPAVGRYSDQSFVTYEYALDLARIREFLPSIIKLMGHTINRHIHNSCKGDIRRRTERTILIYLNEIF